MCIQKDTHTSQSDSKKYAPSGWGSTLLPIKRDTSPRAAGHAYALCIHDSPVRSNDDQPNSTVRPRLPNRFRHVRQTQLDAPTPGRWIQNGRTTFNTGRAEVVRRSAGGDPEPSNYPVPAWISLRRRLVCGDTCIQTREQHRDHGLKRIIYSAVLPLARVRGVVEP